jgi:hypothetical protein
MMHPTTPLARGAQTGTTRSAYNPGDFYLRHTTFPTVFIAEMPIST